MKFHQSLFVIPRRLAKAASSRKFQQMKRNPPLRETKKIRHQTGRQPDNWQGCYWNCSLTDRYLATLQMLYRWTQFTDFSKAFFTSKSLYCLTEHKQMHFIPSTAFPAPLCTTLTNGQQHYAQISSRNLVMTQNVTFTAPNSTQIAAPQFMWVPPVPNMIQIRRKIHKIRHNLISDANKARLSLHRFTKIKFLNNTESR